MTSQAPQGPWSINAGGWHVRKWSQWQKQYYLLLWTSPVQKLQCKTYCDYFLTTSMLLICHCHRNLLKILPELTSAFELDCLLKRTFLHAMPVWELHRIVSSKIFYTSDICFALVTFLCDHLDRSEVREASFCYSSTYIQRSWKDDTYFEC